MGDQLTKHALYRLTLLSVRRRSYAPRDAYSVSMEKKGLVARTGHVDAIRGRIEWEITPAGREALSKQDNAR